MSSKNTFYFNHDCNARDDDKIVAVRMKQGAEGYGIYFMLLELLGCSEGCALRRDYNGLAWQLRVPTEAVKRVVEDYGLFQFSEDGKLFHSARLKTQMDAMSETRAKRSQAGKRGMESRWKTLPDNQSLNNGVITNVTTLDNIKEKKENKIKEGERAPARAREEQVKKFLSRLGPWQGPPLTLEFATRLVSEEMTLTVVAQQTRLPSAEAVEDMLPRYMGWLLATQRRHTVYGDFTKTFISYIKIEQKESSYGTKETDRSNATKRVCHRPEEYGEEI